MFRAEDAEDAESIALDNCLHARLSNTYDALSRPAASTYAPLGAVFVVRVRAHAA
jgi:hypothetical protein